MKLSPVITRIRQADTRFSTRVAGAAESVAALDKGALAFPAAYVIPLSSTAPKPAKSQQDAGQEITERFGVMMFFDNRVPQSAGTADERGQKNSDVSHDARAEIFRAILAWRPTSKHNPIWFEGDQLVELNDSRFVWMLNFAVEYYANETDGFQPGDDIEGGLPDLEKLRTGVDVIDPAADPNTGNENEPGGYPGGYPGPDGRIEVSIETNPPQN